MSEKNDNNITNIGAADAAQTATTTTDGAEAAQTAATVVDTAAANPPRRRHRLKGVTFWNVVQYAILALMVILAYVPMVMGVQMSLKNTGQIYANFFALPNPIQWGNYSKAILELLRPLGNTLYIAAVAIVASTVISSLAAYSFARLHVFGKNILFMFILIMMMIPGVLTLTPSFILMIQLDLRDKYHGLALFYIATSQAFSIFLMRSFFEGQPEDLFESARLDGANELQSLVLIAIPLARPIIVTIGIMNLLSHYNDLIFPMLTLVNPSKQTLMVMLAKYAPPQQNMARPDVAVQTAAYMSACVPLLLIFSVGMKYYVQGITSGAIKG